MGNCKDCKWWASRQAYDGNKWGVCTAPWDKETERDFVYIKPSQVTGGQGELMTSHRFGCLLFEAKQ